jgi:hypothetical protein
MIFGAATGIMEHIYKSYKYRDKSGIIEGFAVLLLLFAAIAGILYYAFFKIHG